MRWSYDEEFEYIVPSGKPLTVAWNMDEDDVEISAIYWEDKKEQSHYTGDELWEMDSELAEDIMSYIETEFLESEAFWLDKLGQDL